MRSILEIVNSSFLVSVGQFIPNKTNYLTCVGHCWLLSSKASFYKLSNKDETKRELKQPRRRRRQKPHKFAYLTMRNSIFARFARAFFIFWHFENVLVLSTTWDDLFCSCVDDVSIWWQMFNFVFLRPKHWFQFNSRIVRTHFSSIRSLNNWKMIAETRSHIFRWRSPFRRRRVCLSSLLSCWHITRSI